MVTSLCLACSTAFGYGTYGPKADGGVKFRVNTSSVSNLNGITLSSGDFLDWVAYAASQWNKQTGLTLDNGYLGTTTGSCSADNSYNDISVLSGCAAPIDGGCTVLATQVYADNDSNGIIDPGRNDLCIWGGSADWEVLASDLGSTEIDLVAVLVHEFGHMLGLADTTNSAAMNGGYQGSSGRYLYSDDIVGMRTIQSSKLTSYFAYWRSWNDGTSSWSSATAFGSSVKNFPVRGTIGTSGGSNYVVASTVANDGASVKFSRAAYPLSGSWTTYSYNYPSWTTPAVTSNESDTFVAAWPLPRLTRNTTCPGFRFLQSTSGFSAAQTYVLTDMCSSLAPGLAYDEDTSLYVMVWVDTFGSNVGDVMSRTSSDGVNWSTPAVLLSRSSYGGALETVNISCGEHCQVSYIRGSSSTPQPTTRRIYVYGAGSVGPSSYNNSTTTTILREVDLEYSKFSSLWHTSPLYTGSTDWKTRGAGIIYHGTDNSNPHDAGSSSIGVASVAPASIIAGGFATEYLFYIQ